MKIEQAFIPYPITPAATKEASRGEEQGLSFADFLNKAVAETNQLQLQSEEMKQQLIAGEVENIHDVMIAAEKANLSFQLTVEVRNKIVEAYQEIMRMQV